MSFFENSITESPPPNIWKRQQYNIRLKIRNKLDRIIPVSKAPKWYKWIYRHILKGQDYSFMTKFFNMKFGRYEYGPMFKKEDGHWYREATWVPKSFFLPDLREIITSNSLKR